MKYLILTLISLITLTIFTSCGLIYTTEGLTKERKKLAEEYGGIYVFNKKLRDEIMQREEERRNIGAIALK